MSIARLNRLWKNCIPARQRHNFTLRKIASNGLEKGQGEAGFTWRKIRKAGSSVYTMDLFKLGGVDMAQPDAVHKAFAVLSGLVDRLDELA